MPAQNRFHKLQANKGANPNLSMWHCRPCMISPASFSSFISLLSSPHFLHMMIRGQGLLAQTAIYKMCLSESDAHLALFRVQNQVVFKWDVICQNPGGLGQFTVGLNPCHRLNRDICLYGSGNGLVFRHKAKGLSITHI